MRQTESAGQNPTSRSNEVKKRGDSLDNRCCNGAMRVP